MPQAIAQSNVQIQADIRNLQAGLNAAVGQLKGFGASVTSLSKQLNTYTASQAQAARATANTATQLHNTGNAVIAANKPLKDAARNMAILTGVVGGLGFLVNRTFVEFEQSIANIAAVTDATASEFMQLNDAARQFGETTIFTASQSANAMTELAKAGFDVSDTINSARGSLNLAAATNSDFAVTTGIMVAALKQFQISTEDSERVANVFAAVIAKSRASMDRLRDSLKFVGPVASSLGLSLEQTSAALGLLFNSGLEASQAGTNLRQALIRLQAPTKQAQKALTDLGLSLEDVNPQGKDLVEIIQAFEQVGAGARDRGDELAKVFGRRAVTAMQVLIRTGGKALQDLENRVTGTNEAARQAAVQIDTLRGAWKLLTSVLQESAIQLGEVLAPTLRFVAEIMRRMAKAFNALPPIVKQVIANVGALTVAVGLFSVPLLLIVAKIPELIASFGLLSATVGGFLPVLLGLGTVLGIATIAITKYFGSQDQARRSTEDSIRTLKESIKTREREAGNLNRLSSEYIELADSANKTKDQQMRLNEIEAELADRYPTLISSTATYAEKLEMVKGAAERSADELQRVAEAKARIEKIELSIKTSELRKQAREIREEFAETSDFFDRLFSEDIDNVTQETQEFVASLESGEDALKNIDTFAGRFVLNSQTLADNLKSVAKTSEGINSLSNDLLRIGEKINQNEQIIAEKKSEQLIAQNNGVELTQQQKLENQKAIVEAFNQIKALKQVEAGYAQIVGKAAELEKLSIEIAANERLRGELANKPATLTVDTDLDGLPVIIGPQPDLDDVKDREKEIAELVFENRRNLLQAELDQARLKDDEILQNKKEAIDKEFQLRLFELEREKGLAIAKAKELGDEELALKREQINKEFDAKRQAMERESQLVGGDASGFAQRVAVIEQERQIAIDKAEQTAVDKEAIERTYTEQFKALVDERSNKLTEAGDDFEARELERQTRMQELQFENDEISAEQFIEFLTAKLEAAKQWSDDYIDTLEKIRSVEAKIQSERVKDARRTANLIVGITNTLGDAFEGELQGMKNIWKKVLIEIVNMFADHYVNLLKIDIIKSLAFGNFAQVARDTAAIAGIRIAEGIAVGAIKGAAVGADVRSGGLAVVHPGERIVPASIVRATRDEHQRAAIMDEVSRSVGAINVNAQQPATKSLMIENIQIVNPMVGDQEFWDRVVEDHISKAFDDTERQRRAKV